MNKDKIKENLAHLRNIQTHLWTAMLVTAGGTLTLLQHLKGYNIVLFILGVLTFSFLFNVYLGKNELIENTI